MGIFRTTVFLAFLLGGSAYAATGDLGVIVERAKGTIAIVNTTTRSIIGQVSGLGDLSHGTAVFSRDQRYAYVFGRDGGLTKVDLLKQRIEHRVMHPGNSIGGAISQDGRLIAVTNYVPGGLKVFDAETLNLVADIPTGSKVVGLVDAPGRRFVFSLFDANQIWIADFSRGNVPELTKFENVGKQPYDALITNDGRTYIAGLFGENGLVTIDLWHLEKGATRILGHYGRGVEPVPIYMMPHLKWLTFFGDVAFLPAIGRHEVLVIDTKNWRQVRSIPTLGQPIFILAQPDKRRIWVNFASPNNDKVQLIDVEQQRVAKTLQTGKGTLHMEFTPRGEEVWLSRRDENGISVLDVESLGEVAHLEVPAPGGIYFTSRAYKIGQ